MSTAFGDTYDCPGPPACRHRLPHRHITLPGENEAAPPPTDARRVLVTLHLPLDMVMVGRILTDVALDYPVAVLGEDGQVWDRPLPLDGESS